MESELGESIDAAPMVEEEGESPVILDERAPEKESERIEIKGYEINYLGDSNEIGSKRFPAKLGSQ